MIDLINARHDWKDEAKQVFAAIDQLCDSYEKRKCEGCKYYGQWGACVMDGGLIEASKCCHLWEAK